MTNIHLKRSLISSWILVFFFFIILLGGGISEFFQTPIHDDENFNRYRVLLPRKELTHISRISFKNPLGSFHLRKTSNEMTPWRLTYPRELPASSDALENIFETLSNVKIRKIYQQDLINISNFSLNRPLIQIEFHYQDKKNKLSFGLINPIDDSTYVMRSDTNAIYHVDALSRPLETLTFSNIIDSKIISFNQNDIKSIKIRISDRRKILLSVIKNEHEWKNQKGVSLNREKIEEYIKSLLSLKSSLILDKVSEKAQRRINHYLSNPLYSMEVMNQKGVMITYKISSIITSLPSVKMEKRQYFIVEASHREYPFLLEKNHLHLFSKNWRSFQEPAFKKLFY